MPGKIAPSKWVESHADSLFIFAELKRSHGELAKDFVRETFLSAFERSHSFSGESSEKTWLTSVPDGKTIDYSWRRCAKRMVPASSVARAGDDGQFFDENWHLRSELLPAEWDAAPA